MSVVSAQVGGSTSLAGKGTEQIWGGGGDCLLLRPY